jgi:hypothetical protein
MQSIASRFHVAKIIKIYIYIRRRFAVTDMKPLAILLKDDDKPHNAVILKICRPIYVMNGNAIYGIVKLHGFVRFLLSVAVSHLHE